MPLGLPARLRLISASPVTYIATVRTVTVLSGAPPGLDKGAAALLLGDGGGSPGGTNFSALKLPSYAMCVGAAARPFLRSAARAAPRRARSPYPTPNPPTPAPSPQ